MKWCRVVNDIVCFILYDFGILIGKIIVVIVIMSGLIYRWGEMG